MQKHSQQENLSFELKSLLNIDLIFLFNFNNLLTLLHAIICYKLQFYEFSLIFLSFFQSIFINITQNNYSWKRKWRMIYHLNTFLALLSLYHCLCPDWTTSLSQIILKARWSSCSKSIIELLWVRSMRLRLTVNVFMFSIRFLFCLLVSWPDLVSTLSLTGAARAHEP